LRLRLRLGLRLRLRLREFKKRAEREGFEPPAPMGRRISSAVHSVPAIPGNHFYTRESNIFRLYKGRIKILV